jgi:hypothetical protein
VVNVISEGCCALTVRSFVVCTAQGCHNKGLFEMDSTEIGLRDPQCGTALSKRDIVTVKFIRVAFSGIIGSQTLLV